MDAAPDKTRSKAKNMAYFGILSGITAFMLFSNPPMEFIFGALALILALLSRSYTGKFTAPAIAALVLGAINILLSLFMYINYLAAIRIMDAPEEIASMIDDPALAQEFNDMIEYYRDILINGVSE